MPVVDLPDDGTSTSDLDPLATLDELKARYDVVDDTQAELALEDVSALIREVAGSETAWSDVSTAPAAIKVICLRATMRYLNNPDGFQNESYGSYSYGYSKDFSVGLFLTDGEIKQIERIAGGAGGVRSIRLTSYYEGRGCRNVYAQPYNDTDPIPVWSW
jgi:hypothetical protein